jgi:hypothetical protein
MSIIMVAFRRGLWRLNTQAPEQRYAPPDGVIAVGRAFCNFLGRHRDRLFSPRLFAMRQRQQAIAGTLEIVRVVGRGAASLVSVPLDRGARS